MYIVQYYQQIFNRIHLIGRILWNQNKNRKKSSVFTQEKPHLKENTVKMLQS